MTNPRWRHPQLRVLAAIVAVITIFLISPLSQASEVGGYWWSGFGGASDEVRAMTIYNGKLIIGGDFNRVGGESIAYLAAWDGEKWSAVGAGPGGVIASLTTYRGDLIAAGYVDEPGESPGLRKYVMRWDGSTWSRVGGALDASIWCLAVYKGDLIAGGFFRTAGGDSCRSVARWDGERWRPLGDGLIDDLGRVAMWTLYVHGEYLYAGGDFTRSGSVPLRGFARWDGHSWSAVGETIAFAVGSMADYEGDLVVSGSHYGEDEITARWDGESWTILERGNYGELSTLNNRLYRSQAGVEINSWDEESKTFLPVPNSRTDGGRSFFRSVLSYDGSLYFCGSFETTGGIPSPNIARWSPAPFTPDVLSFTAERENESAVLHWRPAGSLSVQAAFRIYRAIPGRDREEVFGDLTTTQGEIEFNDPSPVSGFSDYYVSTNVPDGVTRFFGPATLPSIEPPAFQLAQNRPNPFRESTRILFETTRPGDATLQILDVQGREVARPFSASRVTAGPHEIAWDGRDRDGRAVSAGVYWYQLTTPDGRQVRKLVVLR